MLTSADSWKKSLWTKLIAASFIVMIVLGNIWLVQRFSSDLPPFWLQAGFTISIGASFVFGGALLAERLFFKVMRADQKLEEEMGRERESGSRSDLGNDSPEV